MISRGLGRATLPARGGRLLVCRWNFKIASSGSIWCVLEAAMDLPVRVRPG